MRVASKRAQAAEADLEVRQTTA